MICGTISQIEKYKGDPKLYAALEALKQFAESKSYDEKSVASIGESECMTKPASAAVMENHRRYTDIHFVAEGIERILVSGSSRLERISEYVPEKDCELFAVPGDAEKVDLKAGDFLVVYPGESHAPKVALDTKAAALRKVVVKYA